MFQIENNYFNSSSVNLIISEAIFSLENELKESGSNPAILIPRLINHYFWLVDYYVNSNDDERARSGINEILLKIKLLDPNIHEMYIVQEKTCKQINKSDS